jgi:hypothetical protein
VGYAIEQHPTAKSKVIVEQRARRSASSAVPGSLA